MVALPSFAATGQNGTAAHPGMMHHQMKQGEMAAEASVTGEVIGSRCYLEHGSAATGAGHKACAEKCAKAGIPLAILQKGTHRVVWVESSQPGHSANAMLMPYIAKTVTVMGHWVKRGGTEALFISSVKPAAGGSSMM